MLRFWSKLNSKPVKSILSILNVLFQQRIWKRNSFSRQNDYRSEVDCLSLSHRHPYLAYSLMAGLTRTVRRWIIRFALYLSYYISAYAITQLSSSYGFLTQIRHKNMKQLKEKSSIRVRKIWCKLCWLLKENKSQFLIYFMRNYLFLFWNA